MAERFRVLRLADPKSAEAHNVGVFEASSPKRAAELAVYEDANAGVVGEHIYEVHVERNASYWESKSRNETFIDTLTKRDRHRTSGWEQEPTLPEMQKIIEASKVTRSGECTTYLQIALATYGTNAALVVAMLAMNNPEFANPHRVLMGDGVISPEWRDGDLGPEECRRRLEEDEDVKFIGPLQVDPACLIDAAEIKRRMAQG